MKQLATLFLYFFGLILSSIAGDHNHAGIDFIENKGQWKSNVLFEATIPNGKLFLEKDGIMFLLYNPEDISRIHDLHHGKIQTPTEEDYLINGHAFKMNFDNSNPDITTIGAKTKSDYNNYFIGNDSSKWASGVNKFEEVVFNEIYHNIDFKIYSEGHDIKYDFIVKPGGNPKDISYSYEGLDFVELKYDRLFLTTSVNELIDNAPISYQSNKKVASSYILNKSTVSFEIGDYNEQETLIIDPLLIFASYSGSTSDNWGFTATFDSDGHLYAGGVTFGGGYPSTTGSFQATFGGGTSSIGSVGTDISIMKYASNGQTLVYSTYLGGSLNECPHSLIVDGNDELYVLGTTSSSNFPTSTNCYDNTFNGGSNLTSSGIKYTSGSDMFITKFKTDGSNITGSTFVGGSGNDGLNLGALKYNYADDFRGEIIIDNNGNSIIASTTFSTDFPTSPNAAQNTLTGKQDGCVFMLSPNLTNLVWSTYIGGTEDDAAYGVQFNNSGETYFCGGTKSNDFPTTTGALNETFGGVTDGFLVKINSDGTNFDFSTYLGTNTHDQTYFVQLDSTDNVYVIGQTEGSYPIFPSTVYNNLNSGQFLHKLSPDLSTTMLSTSLGTSQGKVDIALTAFLINACDQIYIAGWGGSVNASNNGPIQSSTSGLPITSNAFQTTTDGNDFYLMVLSEDATELKYATFFGGGISDEHVDGGTSRFDKNGIVYQAVCGGCGGNSDFPTSEGSWSQNNNSNNCNIATVKFDLSVMSASLAVINPNICAPGVATFTNESNGGTSFLWQFDDGTTSTNTNPTHSYPDTGTFNVKLIVIDAASCLYSDTAEVVIYVASPPKITVTDSIEGCLNQTVELFATGTPEYIWIPGTDLSDPTIANPEILVSENVQLTVTGNNHCGSDTKIVTISLFIDETSATDSTAICKGESVSLDAQGGTAYNWGPTESLNNSTSPNVVATPTTTTSYYVNIVDNNNCDRLKNILVMVDSILPIAQISNDTIICYKDTITLTASGGFFYNWSSTAWMNDQTAPDPLTAPEATTKYDVVVTNGCGSDETDVVISVNRINSNTTPDSFSCYGDSITLNASGGVVYLWIPTEPLSDFGSSSPSLKVTEPTMFIVKIIDQLFCETLDSIYVDTLPRAFVDAGNDFILEFGTSGDLFPTGEGDSFIWSPSEQVSCDTCFYPTVSPKETTLFNITLTDHNGCKASDSVLVYITGSLYVANTFTPNSDGKNDVFFAFGEEIKTFKMYIFNRWGDIIFESNDIKQGWDGTHLGAMSPDGTYIWKIEYTEISGEEGKKVGHVNLLK